MSDPTPHSPSSSRVDWRAIIAACALSLSVGLGGGGLIGSRQGQPEPGKPAALGPDPLVMLQLEMLNRKVDELSEDMKSRGRNRYTASDFKAWEKKRDAEVSAQAARESARIDSVEARHDARMDQIEARMREHASEPWHARAGAESTALRQRQKEFEDRSERAKERIADLERRTIMIEERAPSKAGR